LRCLHVERVAGLPPHWNNSKEDAVKRNLAIRVFAVAIPLLSMTAVMAETAIQPPLTARGNEPGWIMTVEAGQMSFTPVDGEKMVSGVPEPQGVDGGGARFIGEGMSLTLSPAICHDTMTGMPYPLTAKVEAANNLYDGCAGLPSDLLAGGQWNVVQITDTMMAEPMKIFIAFDSANKTVSGSSGCNNFAGGFDLTGEGMTFGQAMAGTTMACDEPVTTLERSFLDTMSKVTGFDIGSNGELLLKVNTTTVIQAVR